MCVAGRACGLGVTLIERGSFKAAVQSAEKEYHLLSAIDAPIVLIEEEPQQVIARNGRHACLALIITGLSWP